MARARIAILGIHLESNHFAPHTTMQDFRSHGIWRGAEIRQLLDLGDAYGFAATMSALRDWELVPILIADGAAGGRLLHADYLALAEDMESRLATAGPIDAVYIDGHGAGTTTALDDLDGDYFARVRRAVGDIPIVATLDLHANVSDRMVAAVDAIISMRTNPHLDQPERRDEAARMLHRMLDGERVCSALVRLPLVTPQVTQLTAPGEPLGELMRDADVMMAEPGVANVSLLPGFAFGDTGYNGFAVVVSSWSGEAQAAAVANEMANRVWSRRHRFVRALVSIDDGVKAAVAAGLGTGASPVILADIADNPGGGGRGNTSFLLKALLAAGVRKAAVGPIFDAALVVEAWEKGIGATFLARLNRDEPSALSAPLDVQATVVALKDGSFTGKYGMLRKMPCNLGRTCLLDLGGVLLAVSTVRMQTLSPDMLEHCGVDTSTVRCFVVKSRGHFRAGFAHLVQQANILDIDAPGLTTAHLAGVPWSALPRPVYPMDQDAHWAPDDSR